MIRRRAVSDTIADRGDVRLQLSQQQLSIAIGSSVCALADRPLRAHCTTSLRGECFLPWDSLSPISGSARDPRWSILSSDVEVFAVAMEVLERHGLSR